MMYYTALRKPNKAKPAVLLSAGVYYPPCLSPSFPPIARLVFTYYVDAA